MRKVESDESMNCLQCCLSAFFDRPMDTVPTVHKWSKDGYWFEGFYKWCKEDLHHIPVSIVDDTLDDLFHIAVFKENSKYSHAVVAYGTTVVWDPKPGEKAKNLLDVAEWEYSILFVPITHYNAQFKLMLEYDLEGDKL